MALYKTYSPNVKVIGYHLGATIMAMGTLKILGEEILGRHGLKDFNPDRWYPMQNVLDMIREVDEQMGPHTLFQIGLKATEVVVYPPEVASIETALTTLDVTYHMGYRGGEPGHYISSLLGPQEAKVIITTPYPCELDRGILTGVVNKFSSDGSTYADVVHDNNQPCRRKGAESCTFLISWVA